jgi:hypothetical protein
MWVSRTMLQSLTHRPMMVTGMRHIDKQQQAGHVCAVCGELDTAERGTNHLWTDPTPNPQHATVAFPVTDVHSSPAPQATPVVAPTAPIAGNTVHVTAMATDSLIDLRQLFIELTTANHPSARTLRDSFDPMRRIATGA